MSTTYFASRTVAGQQLAQQLRSLKGSSPATVVSLSTEAVAVAVQVAQALACPLQLYLTEIINLPGEGAAGSVNQRGGFSFDSSIEPGFTDYYYQEYHGFLEEAQRQEFSELNRELGGRQVLRADLLKHHVVFIITDCLESTVGLDSLLEYMKPFDLPYLVICAPLALSELMSQLKLKSNEQHILDVLDNFFGVDHYFTDNSVIPREEAIQGISDALRLWP